MLSGLRSRFKQMVFSQDAGAKSSCSSNSIIETHTVPPEKILIENEQFKDIVFSVIRNIKDPEKPSTLEDLNVVYEDGIQITRNFDNTVFKVLVEFTPTVPHCSLASLIGLCIVVKLQKSIPQQTRFKLRVILKKGSHNTVDEIVKQINDKERVAAAMEIGGLKELVAKCISEEINLNQVPMLIGQGNNLVMLKRFLPFQWC
uniref:MIP18 family-like domain-containing protein n=1 Tax=Lygus hesperus TaxID=30085 RepID=A0A0K8THT9_LYGHE